MVDLTKDERALLVVANLTTYGDPRFQWLYQWLDGNAIQVAKLLLEPNYRLIATLTGPEATKANFVDRIVALAQDAQNKVLDVFIHLHGLPGELYFVEGPVKSVDLGAEIKSANLLPLRLLYSTACYGASHAPDFIKAGFRVASGAIATCANGPYDYPAQLLTWRKGETYRQAVKAGNHPVFLMTHDAIARAFGFDDVNSEKLIEGKKLTRITSGPD
jgi:hypothetical protein